MKQDSVKLIQYTYYNKTYFGIHLVLNEYYNLGKVTSIYE